MLNPIFNTRRMVIIAVIALALISFYLTCVNHWAFNDVSHPRHSRGSVNRNFIDNKQAFKELIALFDSIKPFDDKEFVSFSVDRYGRINLAVYGEGFANKIGVSKYKLGRRNNTFETAKLESVMAKLACDLDDLLNLKDKLKATNCTLIRSTNFFEQPVHIYYRESGLGSFSYFVFDSALTEELISIHGEPMGHDTFSSRVVISYSSAL